MVGFWFVLVGGNGGVLDFIVGIMVSWNYVVRNLFKGKKICNLFFK